MQVHFAVTRSDIEEMRRKPGETDNQWAERLHATRLVKATGVAMTLTPETADEEAEIQVAMIIQAFNQHVMVPPFQINELGQKEYILYFS